MSEQFPHLSDIGATLEQVCGERVTEAMARHRLLDTRAQRCIRRGTLYRLVTHRNAPQVPGLCIGSEACPRKDELPSPLSAREMEPVLDLCRDFGLSEASDRILVEEHSDEGQLRLQARNDRFRRQCESILTALSVNNRDCHPLEIQILDTQIQTL